jgi:hypothetical protein
LAGKGIKMGFYEDHQEPHQGKSYNGVGFDDGQGRLWGHELGPDYTTIRIVEQLSQLAGQRERAAREKAYQASFNQALADFFKLYKGDAGKVARILATTTPEQRQEVLNQFTQLHGPEGAKYARQQFEKLDKMTDFQLAAERDKLKNAGHDVGLDKGLRIKRT